MTGIDPHARKPLMAGRIGRRARLAVAALSLAGLAARCAPPCAGPGAHAASTVELLFGRSLHGGGEVSDAQWNDFLATVVTPRFPDGLTVLDGVGQWRVPATGRIVSERSKLLFVVADDTPATRQHLEEVRAAYRTQFAQDSVGLVTSGACAAF